MIGGFSWPRASLAFAMLLGACISDLSVGMYLNEEDASTGSAPVGSTRPEDLGGINATSTPPSDAPRIDGVRRDSGFSPRDASSQPITLSDAGRCDPRNMHCTAEPPPDAPTLSPVATPAPPAVEPEPQPVSPDLPTPPIPPIPATDAGSAFLCARCDTARLQTLGRCNDGTAPLCVATTVNTCDYRCPPFFSVVRQEGDAGDAGMGGTLVRNDGGQ